MQKVGVEIVGCVEIVGNTVESVGNLFSTLSIVFSMISTFSTISTPFLPIRRGASSGSRDSFSRSAANTVEKLVILTGSFEHFEHAMKCARCFSTFSTFLSTNFQHKTSPEKARIFVLFRAFPLFSTFPTITTIIPLTTMQNNVMQSMHILIFVIRSISSFCPLFSSFCSLLFSAISVII